ncbi:MAG: hypothetical protein JWO10_84 [Microbacteriaceae bacterium]|nr:hypothetical protein [Microbacteriaceae bacterium]
MASSFLILHGWENQRPVGHWQHWLTDELEALGHLVSYPQLSDPDTPSLATWKQEIREHYAALPGPVTVICHSLAVLAWLSLLDDADPPHPARLALVAPPSASVIGKRPVVAEFAWQPKMMMLQAGSSVLIASDNDPFCPKGAETEFAEHFDAEYVVLKKAGHITPETGFGPWNQMLSWALNGA